MEVTMRTGKLVLAILGSLLALAAVGLIVGGGGLLWAYGTQRTADGYFTSPAVDLSTESYALSSADIDLGSHPGDWFLPGWLATVRLQADAGSEKPIFVGIGPETTVGDYLDGVGLAEVTRIAPDPIGVAYRTVTGGAPSTPPAEQTLWASSTEGTGLQTLTWDLEPGHWTVVIMNADASAGIGVEVSAAARSTVVVAVAVSLLVVGLIFATIAAVLLTIAVRRQPHEQAPATTMAPGVGGFGHYPVRLEGQVDANLSRWQWLFKWILVIPHLVVLAFLWSAFFLLTFVAGFAILFTGRYPKGIFDFNVGVMRWTWRAGFYSYSALGTDQYPPFTLADADYPATFDVAYPERLSRGLVLVKWWLLAIPHYLIVGLFTSGVVWWTTDLNQSGDAVLEVGGGLIGLLVLIAGVALLFAGRYPLGLFDLVIGLNRWVFRVWAYAALMRDEYPPFRFDVGGTEPGAIPPSPPAGPPTGGVLPSQPDRTSV
jgi:hypothetical protein